MVLQKAHHFHVGTQPETQSTAYRQNKRALTFLSDFTVGAIYQAKGQNTGMPCQVWKTLVKPVCLIVSFLSKQRALHIRLYCLG